MTVTLSFDWRMQSLVALAPAVLVPMITHFLQWTRSLPEDIQVGVAVWVVAMIFQMAHSLHNFQVDRLEFSRVLQVINDNDCLLLELQAHLREIAARTVNDKANRVFLDYCHHRLQHTLAGARAAAHRAELEVHDHHFDTVDTVLDAFDGCQDRTYRCVWRIEEDEKLFDTYWRQYMKALIELNRSSQPEQRVQVRILFVADDLTQLNRDATRLVFRFLADEPGFECRTILADDYAVRARDGQLAMDSEDFGLYGDHLLFRTTSYEPRVGIFSAHADAIQRYRRMHDAAMGAVAGCAAPPEWSDPVSVEEFLSCDTRAAGS